MPHFWTSSRVRYLTISYSECPPGTGHFCTDFNLGLHAWLYILTSCYAMLFFVPCYATLLFSHSGYIRRRGRHGCWQRGGGPDPSPSTGRSTPCIPPCLPGRVPGREQASRTSTAPASRNTSQHPLLASNHTYLDAERIRHAMICYAMLSSPGGGR